MSFIPLALLLALFLVIWVKKPDLPVSSSRPPVSYKSQKRKWNVAFFTMAFLVITFLYRYEICQVIAHFLQ